MGTARPAYGSSTPPGDGGRVASVRPGSPADRAGLREGDVVVSADDHPLADVIDWRWHTDGASVELGVDAARDPSGDPTGDPARDPAVDPPGAGRRTVTLDRAPGEEWGIEFASPLFDGVRTCANRCEFCFMAQLPPGLRRALYVRDDDFRLSFLGGNFITLTNLTDADVERIAAQRLSPLYVSLHAVEPSVRARLIHAREDRALERFDELLAEDIDVHVQIVLVRGVNDGEVLDETLTWLAEREGVRSVGIVPVGYTRHRETSGESFTDAIGAARVIEQVQRWQFAMRERDSETWVHLADEFYLNARAPIPRTEWYDGFPQLENGIGMVRRFADEAAGLRTTLEAALLGLPADEERLTIVTGMMAATTIAGALEACEAVGRVRLLAVPNAFLGGTVSVTGLLAGRDIVSGIAADAHGGVYALPDVVFNDDGLTLDDLTIDDIRERAGARIEVVSADAHGLLDAVVRATG